MAYPIGISTACMYPLETERSLDLMLDLGFRHFETFLNTFSEMTLPFARRLKEKLPAGAEIVSVHPFTSGIEATLFFSEYERRVEDGLEFYKGYFEAAKELGASFLVLHGERGYRNSQLTDDGYLERFLRIAETGASFGITVAQENVNLFRGESVEFIRYMHDQLGDRANFVLDIKQCARAGQDPFEMAMAMGDRLRHVHINDVAPGKECLLPGQGQIDYDRFKDTLDRIGYQGRLMIEVYRTNFGDPEELRTARRFLEMKYNS